MGPIAHGGGAMGAQGGARKEPMGLRRMFQIEWNNNLEHVSMYVDFVGVGAQEVWPPKGTHTHTH